MISFGKNTFGVSCSHSFFGVYTSVNEMGNPIVSEIWKIWDRASSRIEFLIHFVRFRTAEKSKKI